MREAIIAAWILVAAGILLVVMACIGFMTGKSGALDGTFLTVGAFVLVIGALLAIFRDRVVGLFHAKVPGGGEISMTVKEVTLPGGGQYSVAFSKVAGSLKAAEVDISAQNLTIPSGE
ncbi:hypothetical protein FZI85_26675 [Mycobacterium sp. CBMA293]|uniref:hypothetical protein n=1 Tax=unclassified Mycolicibacterium TaxID=2636767 RepID=UPI0012DD2188|nr:MULTISPECIES: hypothetical protein [unclassified Mycolicibacterium]MUL48594.1 hypothetical protein [Mycolicibacterium sp. CBMA 360]MUL62051.1 hypothetical protein [Mycolicibacterium sp. CBMA 335]MUL73326.1 hypothetical protein [Mycolicibacterium sp. CBMA 311]MUL96495.1 hypothetical protein [Mycolicibacterium sp. CBMA 230]MUM05393.1 hypothetical protein [Mycolicibacterium sp. CBMA 213]